MQSRVLTNIGYKNQNRQQDKEQVLRNLRNLISETSSKLYRNEEKLYLTQCINKKRKFQKFTNLEAEMTSKSTFLREKIKYLEVKIDAMGRELKTEPQMELTRS